VRVRVDVLAAVQLSNCQKRVIFSETPLKNAFVIDPEPKVDERGFFARVWCEREYAAHGLEPRLVQISIVFNERKHTLRGMHYQSAPHSEIKVVRCTRGAMFDVIIDLRLDSPTFLEHWGVELSAQNRRTLYIPRGFAQGYQTLEDDTEVLYQMSDFYAPEAQCGVRWNDPAFRISWPPAERRTISARDDSYADFDAAAFRERVGQ
jgi:dTDP-4-dehydrorhamnose 3,5-epimerase